MATTTEPTTTTEEWTPPVDAEVVADLETDTTGKKASDKPAPRVSVLKTMKKTRDQGDGAGAELEDPEVAGAKRSYSKELLALKTADHMAVKEWLANISAQASIQVQVDRKEPKFFVDPVTGQEKKCNGLVARYDQVVDEAEIAQRHGGGTYQLVVKVRNEKGQWQYFNARTIELAGDPKLNDVHRTFVPPSMNQPIITQPAADPIASQMMGKAFDFMAQQANSAGARHGASSAETSALIQAAIAPLQATIGMLTQQLTDRTHEVAAIREHATKGDPFKDQLLSKMLDTESARVMAIRTQHESEVRMLKEQQIANENRIRDQHQRDLDRIEKSHDRELAAIKSSNDVVKISQDTTQSTTKMVLDSEIKRLEKENDALKSELTQLRAKKDMSVKDQIEQYQNLKKMFGKDEDDEDDEEQSTIAKIIQAAGNLPIVEALAGRVAGGGAQAQAVQAAAQQQATQQAAPRRPKLVRDKRTGAVLAPAPDGSGLVQVQRVVPSADGNSQVAIPSVDPAVVKTALDFMENAFRSGTSPETFAETARPMIPASVLGAIRALGIDEFMSKVAQLDGTSPLATQGGRNWRRKVAAKLLGEIEE